MIDVDEVYKVPLNTSNQTETQQADNEKKEDLAAKIDEMNLGNESLNFVENLNLYKSGRFNLYERHVNQMLIRGDNVVTITFAD